MKRYVVKIKNWGKEFSEEGSVIRLLYEDKTSSPFEKILSRRSDDIYYRVN